MVVSTCDLETEEDGKVQIISLAHTLFSAIRPFDIIAVSGFDVLGWQFQTQGQNCGVKGSWMG